MVARKKYAFCFSWFKWFFGTDTPALQVRNTLGIDTPDSSMNQSRYIKDVWTRSVSDREIPRQFNRKSKEYGPRDKGNAAVFHCEVQWNNSPQVFYWLRKARNIVRSATWIHIMGPQHGVTSSSHKVLMCVEALNAMESTNGSLQQHKYV